MGKETLKNNTTITKWKEKSTTTINTIINENHK